MVPLVLMGGRVTLLLIPLGIKDFFFFNMLHSCIYYSCNGI